MLGATGRIGREVCRALLGAGASVVMVDRDADRLEAMGVDLGPDRTSWLVADPTSQLEVHDAREAALARLGRVDLLVVSSGVVTGSAFEDGIPADWAEMIDVNLRGLLHAAQTFADPLLEAARRGEPADLVFLGAVGAHMDAPRFAVFNAVSTAVKQLSRTLRQEYGPRGLRVHTLELGFRVTEFGPRPEPRNGYDAHFPRVSDSVQPEAVGALVAMAASLPAGVNLAELVVTPTEIG